MDEKFWKAKWQNNEIGFHQAEIHPSLLKFGDKFRPGKIFVPLCGKTLDMIYLRDTGHEVIGVELSEIACRAFMQENDLPFTEEKSGEFLVFKTKGIELWCGDFFKLPDFVWKDVVGVYDRAALVALPFDLRSDYVTVLNQKLPMKSDVLLVTFVYAKDQISGPPFSIPELEVDEHYRSFLVDKIFSEEVPLRDGKCLEETYWMTRKGE